MLSLPNLSYAKFRGKTVAGKKFVYGGYFYDFIKKHHYIIALGNKFKDFCLFEVFPNSIAQLVYINSDGQEIYEGDVVVDKDGNEYIANLMSIADGEIDFYSFEDEYAIDGTEFVLKEDDDDEI